jgi:hypothetical protein
MVTVAFAAIVAFLEMKFGWLLQPIRLDWPGSKTVIGAALFAAGALINGACALGTLGRLARGDIGYVATLVSGVSVIAVLTPDTAPICHAPVMPPVGGLTWLLIVIGTVLALLTLARRHVRPFGLITYAVLGVTAAALANLQGNWTWLSLAAAMRQGMSVELMAFACVGAALIGAAVMALFRHRFRFVRPDPRRMVREAIGGALMAAGAILIPGGNDSLLVTGLPAGDPNALAAYAIMFALMFLLLRHSAPLRAIADWSRN